MKYLDYVNIKMGTDSVPEFSNGNTLPLVTYPFGANHYAIETRNATLFFNSHDVLFKGIRLTHRLSPWLIDYDYITMMPAILDGRHLVIRDTNLPISSYNRDHCSLSPASMSLHLNFFNIDMDFAPTKHGGILKTKYNFKSQNNIFSLDMGCSNFEYSVCDDNKSIKIKAMSKTINSLTDEFKMYSYYQFSRPFSNIEKIGSKIVVFYSGEPMELDIKFATSFVSYEQALLNYKQEVNDFTIHMVKEACENIWEKMLSKIEIEANIEIMKTFYSCFYRCFLFPRALHEIDENGEFVHASPFDGKIYKGPFYTDNCFWDTYKTSFPLYSIIASDLYAEMCEGFLNFYRESGWLPRCAAPNAFNCMPGTAIDAVFADAVVKGVVTDENVISEMFEALNKHASIKSPNPAVGRDGIEDFNKLGYVSNAFNESVNKTLDYAYGNYCISKIAKKLCKIIRIFFANFVFPIIVSFKMLE